MYNFWTQSKKYRGFRQLIAVAFVLVTGAAQGQVVPHAYVQREPASYIPDDDVIVKPVDNEISFYQRYVATDNSEDVVRSRNQLKVWNDNQIFAEQYGMDSSLAGSPFYVPTQQEKLEYFKNKYMRYLRSRGEQPLRDMPKNWYNQYRATNEVDTIDELEGRFKSTHFKSHTGKTLPGGLQQKEINVWKKTTFIFQPRVDQGLVIVGLKNPFAYARAWVGVNGKTEFNVQKNIDEIGFRLMWNYTANTGKYFTSIDQRIVENVYARVTLQKNPQVAPGTDAIKEDNSIMLLYAKQF